MRIIRCLANFIEKSFFQFGLSPRSQHKEIKRQDRFLTHQSLDFKIPTMKKFLEAFLKRRTYDVHYYQPQANSSCHFLVFASSFTRSILSSCSYFSSVRQEAPTAA